MAGRSGTPIGRTASAVIGIVAAAVLSGCAMAGGGESEVEYVAWAETGVVGTIEYSAVEPVNGGMGYQEDVDEPSWVERVDGGAHPSLTVTPPDEGARVHCLIIDAVEESVLVALSGRPGEPVTCEVERPEFARD